MDKEKIAIERLKTAAEMSLATYQKPLIITYSGGKDSEVLLELAKRSGIDFEVNHSHTTADAPPTVYHIRKVFKELEAQGIKCTIEYPRMSMWELIVHKCICPTRIIRFCCRELKENKCKHRMIATGVRWDESVKRKKTRGIYEDMHSNTEKKIILMNDNDDKRRLFERCQMQAKTIVNPIIDFTTEEIWEFYNNECKYKNPLYDMGFKRVGCIGCPMASKSRLMEFEAFPKYKELYIRTFDKMLEHRKEKGLETRLEWKTGQDVFDWWING
ncbi:MAG: phosphoadenosine phosphosulfate reductase family protein [Firmicutes bacterium]|nr:phosphoadenosine phosphosulfate reductase family protein [Bacillota bacterium]